MVITAEQRAQRIHNAGASDVAAILGVSPFQTAYDVWLEKTGQVDPQKETAVMYLGNTLEDGVLNFAADRLGELRRNVTAVHSTLPLAANFDAVLVASGEPVEAKTSGIIRSQPGIWGEDGSDDVPEHYIVQCHAQMIVAEDANPQVCHLAALIGGRGFGLFHIPRNSELCAIIAERVEEFWTKYVTPKKAPPDTLPTIDVAKRIKRVANKVVNVPAAAVQNYLDAKAREKLAKEQAEEAQAALMAALGDAEEGDCGPLGKVTYFEQHRKGYEVKPTTFRVLRHSTPKA